jgi:hypothetical protein
MAGFEHLIESRERPKNTEATEELEMLAKRLRSAE